MHYVIYHPKRQVSNVGQLKIYHDKFGGNEDPYIWNKKFLHSFCHITQISPIVGSHIFWVSGDSYPDFTALFCDCVFVVKEKIIWNNANSINFSDEIVDSQQAFSHHYSWVNPPFKQHYFKSKKRHTLKGDEDKSFQPQDKNFNLIDICPYLISTGYTLNHLRDRISKTSNGEKARNSRPLKIDGNTARLIYQELSKSSVLIRGNMLMGLHP